MTGAELIIEKLRVRYGADARDQDVLAEVDLNVAPGEVVGLAGESGSGKSTLAYSIVGYLGRSAHVLDGSIRLDGEDVLKASPERLREIRSRSIAMVYQDPSSSLNPTMTLGSQLIESIRQSPTGPETDPVKKARELLDRVNIPKPSSLMERYPHQVSGGEKQRVVIAMALAVRPKLMICDEPTTALDATTAAQVLELLRRLKSETGVSILFISHDLGTVADFADRSAVIYGGHIVEVGEVSSILRRPEHPYTQNLLTSTVNSGRQAVRRRILTMEAGAIDRANPAHGCVYANRCRFVTDACRAAKVELAGPELHQVACIRRGDQALRDVGLPPPSTDQERRASASTLLDVRDLSINYGRDRLLGRLLNKPSKQFSAASSIDFTIGEAETVGLVGESGCGKSTLARSLAGLTPFTGTISFCGKIYPSVAALNARYRNDVQIIFQHPDAALNPRHTIGQILARPVKTRDRLRGEALNERVRQLLDMVRLPADYASRYSYELSGGEKQRVCIARAFASKPMLVICDEITSGLDVSVQGAILNLLADLQDESGISYLFITHDLNVVQHIADRILVMYLGRVVEIRDTRNSAPPYHPYTEALFGAVPVLDPTIATRSVRLQGQPPDPKNPPIGCSLHGRCHRLYGDVCRTRRPALDPVGMNHKIACHIPVAELEAVPPLWSSISSESGKSEQ